MVTQRFYKTHEVADLFGVSQSTVWRWLKVGTLPRPVHAPGGWAMWPADEIDGIHDAGTSRLIDDLKEGK